MATPPKIIKLIERFHRNIESYRSANYNETQVRREFIDPMFKELGWDVDNEKGYAETYKEVVHEDAVKVGGFTKAPDYSFRVGGTRKFFVEAKKPAVNLRENISPAYQLRRYAWSAKLPLSILTDFEEFAVYDCRMRPSIKDKPAMARILYYKYTEYLESWDSISEIFHHEQVLKGSFDRYAASTARKKGTAEVDASFLCEIESWRDLLARNIAIRNPSLTQNELNYAVQKIIDRIIFLRICEDRGIEEYGKLMSLLSGPNAYSRLCEMFTVADHRFNSGLFHFSKEKSRPGIHDEITPRLTIADKTLKSIIQNLYYPESPYEFSVLGADILGQVYEQFLGKVIRLTTGHRAKVEEKPEVRKAGGVYYTPTFIVDHIVKSTVGKLLEDKKPGARGSASKLKVLDPACGSGSFLLGAYQCILDWHLKKYTENDPDKLSRAKRPVIFQDRHGEWKLTTTERKRILTDNIFGVDIDPQAVEVTKLSLLLKVLENENAETLNKQLALFHERALPDLGNNIKCGNSLISPDFFTDGQQGLFEEKMQNINAFDWTGKYGFSDIIKNGGFDVVIGNPPYVRQETLGKYKEFFQKNYETYHGTADLYTYFVEKGVSLLKKNGIFSYIVANKWMRANYGTPLRKWLKEQNILSIVDFGDLPVFKSATTYPCILTISKSKPGDAFQAAKLKTLEFTDLSKHIKSVRFQIERHSLKEEGWPLIYKRNSRLLDKLLTTGIPLGDYVEGKIYRGVLTGLNKAFVIDYATRQKLIKDDPKSKEIIKPFAMGRDIKRYNPLEIDRYLIFTRRGIPIDDYPTIKDHLSLFREELTPRPKDWKGTKWKGRKPGNYEWYEIQDAIDYYLEFEKPKIMYAEISTRGQFILESKSSYSGNTTYILGTDSLYLLGILNSKLTTYILSNISSEIRGGFYRWIRQYVQQLPIIQPNQSNLEEMHKLIGLVESMIKLRKAFEKEKIPEASESIKRDIETIDKQIDKIVYLLHGLEDKEISIIENCVS